ncbi:hypothetical protein BDP67DRAFT_118340 [Colletotrichum lupini]|nr:hypothetical protein BDP67DRAFT_118340 [Colletotrichum lupini]
MSRCFIFHLSFTDERRWRTMNGDDDLIGTGLMDIRLEMKRETIARQAWRSWDFGKIQEAEKMEDDAKKNDYDDTKPTSATSLPKKKKRRVRCGIPRTQLRYAGGEGVRNAAATANASHRGQKKKWKTVISTGRERADGRIPSDWRRRTQRR